MKLGPGPLHGSWWRAEAEAGDALLPLLLAAAEADPGVVPGADPRRPRRDLEAEEDPEDCNEETPGERAPGRAATAPAVRVLCCCWGAARVRAAAEDLAADAGAERGPAAAIDALRSSWNRLKVRWTTLKEERGRDLIRRLLWFVHYRGEWEGTLRESEEKVGARGAQEENEVGRWSRGRGGFQEGRRGVPRPEKGGGSCVPVLCSMALTWGFAAAGRLLLREPPAGGCPGPKLGDLEVVARRDLLRDADLRCLRAGAGSGQVRLLDHGGGVPLLPPRRRFGVLKVGDPSGKAQRGAVGHRSCC